MTTIIENSCTEIDRAEKLGADVMSLINDDFYPWGDHLTVKLNIFDNCFMEAGRIEIIRKKIKNILVKLNGEFQRLDDFGGVAMQVICSLKPSGTCWHAGFILEWPHCDEDFELIVMNCFTEAFTKDQLVLMGIQIDRPDWASCLCEAAGISLNNLDESNCNLYPTK